MCGRLTQYRGIHDFVAALSMPNALVNNVGDHLLERYNAAPTTQLALFHQEGSYVHADMVRWGWRPHWATDRAAPINARVEKVAHGPFFRAIDAHTRNQLDGGRDFSLPMQTCACAPTACRMAWNPHLVLRNL